MARYTDTDSTTDTDNTRLLINGPPPDPRIGPWALLKLHQKTLKWASGSAFLSVPQVVDNSLKRKRAPVYQKKMHFVMCTFPNSRSKFAKTQCFKQHACSVDSLGVLHVFHSFPNSCFSTTKKPAQTMKKEPAWGAHSSNWAPKIPKKPIPIPKKKLGSTRAHSEF